MGEFLPIGRTANARAVAGGAGSAERNVRLVGHGLVIDVQETGAQPIAEGEAQPDQAERLALSAQDLAWLQRFAAELDPRARRSRWDALVDGLNRLPRPVITLSVGAFFAAVAGLIDWSIVGIVVLGIIVLIGTALLALAVGVWIRPLRARAHWSVRLLLELATDALVGLPILGYVWLLSLFIRSH